MQANKFSNLELLKELEKQKNDSKNEKEILAEVNKRISEQKINFKGKENKFVYIYMLISNKLNSLEILNKLIKNKEFIKSIDIAEIDGSAILSLTDKCNKPRTELLSYSENIKTSILKSDTLFSTRDLLSELTKEEVLLLREDLEIDNYLISNGLRFDALKEETIEKIVNDISIFETYSIDTIREFANNYKNAKELANNKKFIGIYLSKMDNYFTKENKLFSYLTIKQIKELKDVLTDNSYLQLVKDSNPKVQAELLKLKNVQKILVNCSDINILESLPKENLIVLLAEKDNLLSGINLMMLKNLNKQELSKVAKTNRHFYSDLVEKIAQNDNMDFRPFINALPANLLIDLGTNKISEFNFDVLKKLLNSNKNFFKGSILNNKGVSNYLVDRQDPRDILELLDDSDFNNEERIRLLNNCTAITNAKNICEVVYTIPENLRLPIYKNDYLRELLLNEKSFKLDSYTTKYLLNNFDEINSKPVSLILSLLIECDLRYCEEILSSEEILTKLFKEGAKESPKLLADLVATKPSLVKFYKKEVIKKYYNRELLNELNKVINQDDMNTICSNEVLNTVYDSNQELIGVYKKLLNNNSYLLNTLNFNMINATTAGLKLAILEKIVKYPNVQENILAISKKYPLSVEFLNQLYFATEELDFATTVNEALNIFRLSVEGENRKRVGNLAKMISVASPNEIPKKNFAKLLNYLLYFVPRYNINTPCIIKTPITFNEILSYEKDYEKELTELIAKGKDIRENFLLKHFKLTSEQAYNIVNRYSIKRIDEEIYKDEYFFLEGLFKALEAPEIELQRIDKKTDVMSMFESFVAEEQIKKMFGKIFNYEIRSKAYTNKPILKEIFGKELRIYNCPSDFLFLISNVDIREEYQKTNSFLLGWHNTVNKMSKGLHTSLISNDNLHLEYDITFGFNGLLEDGLIDMSPYYNNNDTKFMTPRELIDNTRDNNNKIILDRYAIRPNFNNSNLPNIEPDYILVDANRLNDNTYLEKISRASSEFKTKRNKDGLPIIAIDMDKIAANEVKKIDAIFTKYQKTHDMTLIPSILTKLNNNNSAYRRINKELADKFNPIILLEEIKKRINISNSLRELDYIEETFINEEKKYRYLVKDFDNEDVVKEIKKAIDNRISKINRG